MLSVNYAECRNPYAESRYAERRGAFICATLKFKFILPRKHKTRNLLRNKQSILFPGNSDAKNI